MKLDFKVSKNGVWWVDSPSTVGTVRHHLPLGWSRLESPDGRTVWVLFLWKLRIAFIPKVKK